MQLEPVSRHNDDMSEMPQEPKPVIEEDAKLARIFGVVLFVIVPIFGFYYGTVFGKTNPVDGKIWFFDYMTSDLVPGGIGALIGLAIAGAINYHIWFRYKKQVEEDLINEWYDPQSHKSAGHH